MSEKLAKLNRLRLNAGKAELKSWKASQPKLDEAIKKLEDAGHVDVVPGANPDAPPVIADPEVAKARPEPKEKPKPENYTQNGEGKEPTKCKPGLGRGLHDEKYAVHSRKAVQDHRRDERNARKNKAGLSEEEQRGITDEANFRKGQVDPKKDPAKAKRQADKIAAKQEARKKAGKTAKSRELGKDEISVADIARSLGIDPKIARAKLRRHEDKITKLHTKGQDRWVFPKSAEKEIAKILK